MGNLGTGEIIIIVLVILIFFGPKKIPEIAQGIGKGMREFKKAMKDVEDELKYPPAEKPSQKQISQQSPDASSQTLNTNTESKEEAPKV